MIKRHFFRFQNIKKFIRCLFFLLHIPFSVNSQENSTYYSQIINNDSLSKERKEFKIDSLLNTYVDKTVDSLIINDLYDYAKWQFIEQNNLEKAIEKSLLSLHKIERRDSSKNSLVHYKALNNLGYFYKIKGDFQNAFLTQKKITNLKTSVENKIEAYKLAGNNLSSLGDFYQAIDYYNEAISVSKKNNLNDTDAYLQLCIDASINYREINNSNYTRYTIEVLLEIINRLNTGALKTSSISSSTLFSLYNQLGNLYSDTKDYDFYKASKHLKKSLELALENNNSKQIGFAYNDLGFLYTRARKPEALSYLDNAIKHLLDNETKSIAYSNKALYYSLIKHKENTLTNAQKAINVLVNNDSTKNLPLKDLIIQSPHKYELLTALIEKAEYVLKFYNSSKNKTKDLTEALEIFTLADRLVDEIRFISNEKKSKLFWRDIASQIYTNATRTCFLLNKPEEAFYFMEKNKSLLLLEDVTRQQLKEKANIPLKIVKRQQNLKAQIITSTEALNNKRLNTDSINSRIFKQKETYNQFLDSIQFDYLQYYKSQRPANILDIAEAQKTLKDKQTAYISYILNNDFGYGLIITKSTTQLFEINNINDLFEHSTKYRELLEKPLQSLSDINHYNTFSYSIYNQLFPKSIREKLQITKLIIIPDYYLQNIPFEALITSEKNRFLIEDYDISYAYSISFLIENNKIKRNNQSQFFGLAPINFNSNLASLPQSKYEIEHVSKLFTSEIYLNENATSKNFFDHIENHNIIHLASHANANDSINPWIAFSDKKISLNEIYLSKNSADLVVLSACKTSLGELNKGEGVMSLARGFFNTGSNSILSSLWDVNDQSSSEIMIDFYKNLKDGKTKSEALRLSKLNYIKSHELSEVSPHYWASFVLIGDSETIPSITQNNPTVLILGAILLLGLVYFVYRKIKK